MITFWKKNKEYRQGWLQRSFWIGVNSTGTPSMLPANTELFTAYLAYWMPCGTCMWFGLGVILKKKIIISHGISRKLTLEIQNVKGLSTIIIQKKNPSSCSYGNNGGNIEYIPKEKKRKLKYEV